VPGWVGPGEIIILLVVALLVFGPKKLPEMGRSIGKGMREFKNSVTGYGEETVELPPSADEPAQAPKTDTT
jgi:sec-independent protein translocase protein TatA